MTPAQIDAVIAGLTRAQREVFRWNIGGWVRPESAAWWGLWKKGLLDRQIVDDRAEYRYSADGLAVRQRLVEMGEG